MACYVAQHLHVAVVGALLSGVRWANHAAIAVLGLFVFYQLFEWYAVGGKMLLVLTAIDLFVISLTYRENQQKQVYLSSTIGERSADRNIKKAAPQDRLFLTLCRSDHRFRSISSRSKISITSPGRMSS